MPTQSPIADQQATARTPSPAGDLNAELANLADWSDEALGDNAPIDTMAPYCWL